MKKLNWPEEVYQKMSVADLILVSLYLASNQHADFEELTKNCFKLFPQKFSFESLRQWPDSRILDRPLRLLKTRKKIYLTKQKEIALAPAGRRRASEIINFFRQKRLSH